MQCHEDIRKRFRHEDVSKNPPMHPVDLLAIALQADPIPVKDLKNLKSVTKERGKYLGARDMVLALQQDVFKRTIGGSRLTLNEESEECQLGGTSLKGSLLF